MFCTFYSSSFLSQIEYGKIPYTEILCRKTKHFDIIFYQEMRVILIIRVSKFNSIKKNCNIEVLFAPSLLKMGILLRILQLQIKLSKIYPK